MHIYTYSKYMYVYRHMLHHGIWSLMDHIYMVLSTRLFCSVNLAIPCVRIPY